MKSNKYSYSKINLFNSCSLKYKFLYVDKNYKKEEGIEAFLGKLIHETLEWIYKKKIEESKAYYSLDSIINFYKEAWNDKWHHNILKYKYIKRKKVDYFTSGVNFLVKYYQIFGPSFNQNVYKVEEKIEFELGGYTIKAIIDRIDMDASNKIHIIDYKTGRNMLSDKKMKEDMQMAIYGIGISSVFPEVSEIILSHYYLAANKFVSVNLSDIDTKSFSDGMIENIKDIEKTEAEQSYVANESKLCNWCYYWKECPVKNGSSPSEYIK